MPVYCVDWVHSMHDSQAPHLTVLYVALVTAQPAKHYAGSIPGLPHLAHLRQMRATEQISGQPYVPNLCQIVARQQHVRAFLHAQPLLSE